MGVPDEVPLTTRANNVITETLSTRDALVVAPDPADPDVTITYLLGDTFHSTPLVIGTPPNTNFFALDVGSELNVSTATCGGTDEDHGYRCFSKIHSTRRRVLGVGSNTGMAHFIDTGIFRETGSDGP